MLPFFEFVVAVVPMRDEMIHSGRAGEIPVVPSLLVFSASCDFVSTAGPTAMQD